MLGWTLSLFQANDEEDKKKQFVCKFHSFALPAENDWLECVRF